LYSIIDCDIPRVKPAGRKYGTASERTKQVRTVGLV
jgi:hypothetical protein